MEGCLPAFGAEIATRLPDAGRAHSECMAMRQVVKPSNVNRSEWMDEWMDDN